MAEFIPQRFVPIFRDLIHRPGYVFFCTFLGSWIVLDHHDYFILFAYFYLIEMNDVLILYN